MTIHFRHRRRPPAIRGPWLLIGLLAAGCGFDPRWPSGPSETREHHGDTLLAYRIDGAKRPNYFQRVRDGRVTALHFDDNGDGQYEQTIELSADDPAWPHCVLVLDGVPFTTVDEMWREGRFRIFPPPSRMITVFPAMTDLALTKIFGTPSCVADQALYFDAKSNQLMGGSMAYLRGRNAPWLPAVTYHAPQDIGAWAYLTPQSVFDREMRGTLATFRGAKSGLASAYSIGTAGLGTRGGRDAIRRYLLEVERLCERVLFDHRGRVKISLMADHGHHLTRARRVRFEPALEQAGFRRAKRIDDDRDVVIPEYGLVTYASVYTRRPAEVATALVNDPAVELAAYRRGDVIVVRSKDGEAEIGRRERGYSYRAVQGDPLQLAEIVARLQSEGQISADGTIEDRPLFEATAEHVYPDALHRLWESLHGLMQSPPDVYVSLRPDACHGSRLFELGIGRVASTHGALERMNSTTFVLSTIGDLPAAIRIDDVLDVLHAARRAAQGQGASSTAPATAPADSTKSD